MERCVLDDAESVAESAARFVADVLRDAIAARGRATLALSGGRTPARMLERLATASLPWPKVHVFQTDERVVAGDDPASNAHAIRRLLTERIALPPSQIHFMPVESGDVEGAARAYQATLRAVAGTPPRLDLVHLGLGADGHTASLFPGDATATERERDVAVTPAHGGWRRMTLTAPVLEGSRRLLWLVCGAEKRPALGALLRADPATPAGRLPQDRARLFADREAAGDPVPEPR